MLSKSSVYERDRYSMKNLCMIELRDAEACLPELISRVEGGEEILITRDERPAALLCGIEDDLAAERELLWEREIGLTLDAERSGEVTLYASIG
jgi:antitoxin (DNA-binding transcriptional repressor) of toxin-antitoxin stability system